jgi:hypothetical protein
MVFAKRDFSGADLIITFMCLFSKVSFTRLAKTESPVFSSKPELL